MRNWWFSGTSKRQNAIPTLLCLSIGVNSSRKHGKSFNSSKSGQTTPYPDRRGSSHVKFLKGGPFTSGMRRPKFSRLRRGIFYTTLLFKCFLYQWKLNKIRLSSIKKKHFWTVSLAANCGGKVTRQWVGENGFMDPKHWADVYQGWHNIYCGNLWIKQYGLLRRHPASGFIQPRILGRWVPHCYTYGSHSYNGFIFLSSSSLLSWSDCIITPVICKFMESDYHDPLQVGTSTGPAIEIPIFGGVVETNHAELQGDTQDSRRAKRPGRSLQGHDTTTHIRFR